MWLVSACGLSPIPTSASPVPLAPAIAAPAVLAAGAAPSEPPSEPIPAGPFRREVAPGLVVAAYDPPAVPPADYAVPDAGALVGTDPRLVVVTIDPARYDLRYLSILDPALAGVDRMPADGWADRYDLQVAWNPGMFEPDGHATGWTRAGSVASQDLVRSGKLYRAWFVAGTRVAVLDQVPVAGGWPALPEPFRTELGTASFATQSLPILRDGAPAYPPRKNLWSELCFGTDRDGNVVVVFSRWPYEMRELGARIAALDLGITGLVHGEGGPEATLVVRTDTVAWTWVGSYETGFSDDANTGPWPLPAVLGARPR